MRTHLIILFALFGIGCEDPENPCNAGGPQTFTFGTYDADSNHFDPWENGSTVYMSNIASDSGQGGFSSIRPGTHLNWLVTGMKTKKAQMTLSMRLEGGEEYTTWGEGGKHTCIPNVGAVGEMPVQFLFPLDEVDLIGQTIEISIDAAYKQATLSTEMSGTLDLEF